MALERSPPCIHAGRQLSAAVLKRLPMNGTGGKTQLLTLQGWHYAQTLAHQSGGGGGEMVSSALPPVEISLPKPPLAMS